MRLGRRWLVAAVVLVLGGCRPEAEPARRVPSFEVEQREAFVRRVTAEGYLKAVEATPLSAPEDAQRPMKVAWVAEDGKQVEEGEVVVRFDATEMERKLADSQDDVTAAQREIAKERALGAATGRKRDRTAELSRYEMDLARALQTDDERILSRNEIIETRIDVELAQAKSDHARKVKAVEGTVSRSQIGVHEVTERHAAAEVERAEEGLKRLEIAAPHAGLLVLERDWRGNTLRVGDTIWRGQKVAELPLVTEMKAELFVLEADAGDLAEGLRAELVVEAHPGTVYEAEVSQVDTLAKPRHEDVPVQYFGVTLKLPTTDPSTMKVGQRVRATIFLEQDAAIVVPRQAVFEDDGELYVWRESLTGYERVTVTLGPSSAGRVVITEGLDEGDRIALRDPNRSADELLAGDDEGAPKKAEAPGGPVQ